MSIQSTSEHSSMLSLNTRNVTVDLMRTCAIFLMVVFHFIFDLKHVGVVEVNIPNGNYWMQFRWVILTLFFLCVGISLRLSFEKHKLSEGVLIGFCKTSIAACIVTLVSILAIPENWIFFGVLHFIAMSYIFAMPLIRYPRTCLILGVSLLIIGSLQLLPSRWPFYLFWDGLPKYTNDYVRLIPWFGMVLVGVNLGTNKFITHDFAKSKTPIKLVSGVSLISKNSLIIYLVHQPILLGILFLCLKT